MSKGFHCNITSLCNRGGCERRFSRVTSMAAETTSNVNPSSMMAACVANGDTALTHPRQIKRMRLSRSTDRWWAVLLAVSQLLALLSKAEAAGWMGGTGGNTGQRGAAPTSGRDDDDMSEALNMLERKQFWGEVEHVGLEALENEVAEKKRRQLFGNVAKACSVGAQMTLIMGGGALLFRLLPVFLGRDREDEEEAEANSPLLLRSGVDSNPLALPPSERRRLLTDGSSPSEFSESNASEAVGAGGAGSVGEEEADGGGAAVKAAETSLAVVSTTLDGEEDAEDCDGEVVAFTRRGAALKRARRLSRPFLKVVAVPLSLLLAARLVLGGQLAKRVDPTIELLFGDDIVDLYAEKVDMPSADDVMPFAMDSDFVPGRTKMMGRKVQRPPRPDGEEDAAELEEDVLP